MLLIVSGHYFLSTMSKGHSHTSLRPIQNFLHRGRTLHILQLLCNAKILELPDNSSLSF